MFRFVTTEGSLRKPYSNKAEKKISHCYVFFKAHASVFKAHVDTTPYRFSKTQQVGSYRLQSGLAGDKHAATIAHPTIKARSAAISQRPAVTNRAHVLRQPQIYVFAIALTQRH